MEDFEERWRLLTPEQLEIIAQKAKETCEEDG